MSSGDALLFSDISFLKSFQFGIITTDWHEEVMNALYKGCTSVLEQHEVPEANIYQRQVPGSFEIPLGAQYMVSRHPLDVVICLGCIIKGETKHDEYIAQAVSNGLKDLNLKYNKPFIFGILTTQNLEQAKERAGGKKGNKGREAGEAALKMARLTHEMKG